MTSPPPVTSSRKDDISATQTPPNESQDHAASINKSAFDQNTEISINNPASTPFKARTIAPSPSPDHSDTSNKNNLLSINTSPSPGDHIDALGIQHVSPLSAGLRVRTDIPPNTTATIDREKNASHKTEKTEKPEELPGRTIKPIGAPLSRTPSIREAFLNRVNSNSNIGSATDSALSSPMLSAMSDVTPLPSPLLSGDSPGPWRKIGSRPTSRESSLPFQSADAAIVAVNGESLSSAIVNQSKRKAYHGLITAANESALANPHINREKDAEGRHRNRSISEYIPDPLLVQKPRQQAVSGSHAALAEVTQDSVSADAHMRREPHLAIKRGITKPPTPPSSRAGEGSDSESTLGGLLHSPFLPEYFEARTIGDGKRRRWRAIKWLGKGTFSNVVLATSQKAVREKFSQNGNHQRTEDEHEHEYKNLVAIKICEHGPKGGASEERVEMSLKREVEIMKLVHHPSLVQLKAFSIDDTRALLVLPYCPGGDLFEVASEHRNLLIPSLLQRVFAELVGALNYLHERHIVHRDIKLENVLVNLPQAELAKPTDWSTYPYSVTTLTDLGLSRMVADDEKLTTRCGSDDYAAPEVIMGQPYDGRAVDAWSLGVLLYALLESRLPFDVVPNPPDNQRNRSRTSHRIARVEWRWYAYAGEDGDHEGDIAKFEKVGLRGAMEVTENLLKRARSRWTLERVAQEHWVKEAIAVEGGIKFREEVYPEEVS